MVQGTEVMVWKELAISKQILLKTVTDALGLDSECSEAELNVALAEGVNKISKAGSIVAQAKKENQATVDKLENKLRLSEKAREELETNKVELEAENARLNNLLTTTRKNTEQEIKRLSGEVEDKKKQLKNINVMLADTPDNVVKKLKTLNKKKFDDQKANKRLEDELKNIKKEKRELIDQKEKLTTQSSLLAEKHRELQTLSQDQFTQLKELVEDESTLKKLPELDEELLNSLAEAA